MSAASRDTLPMSVADMTFLVNKLGEECGPLQYIRELTQNAIEGVIQTPDRRGDVVWDVNWPHHELDGVYKLSCIDTGIGMTGLEMVEFINKLSSSIHQQSAAGNFGIGAKIAAAPRNRHGVVYLSWKNGVGHMIHLWFDPESKVYGLKRWPQNGNEHWTPISDDLKPTQIIDHGTMVVLLGGSDDDDTMQPPLGTPMRSRWVLRYLNTRYFRFPDGVTVRAREGWELPQGDTRHNFLRIVEGQEAWLNRNCQSKGSIDLSDAVARWWILKSTADKDSGHTAPGGHVAALFQNELYEMAYGRAGIARLQAFGVIFGTDRVVLYIEPHSAPEIPVTANTARTQLILNGEPLDWSAWAAGFREKMPDEIADLQNEIGAQAGDHDYKKAIMDRLRQIKDLLRFARFRPAKDGSVTIDPQSGVIGGMAGSGGSSAEGNRQPGNKGGRAGDLYALFAESSPTTGDPVDVLPEPEVKWLSVSDHTRTPPDLDDRAAKFLLAQNTLLINGDFRVFVDMVDRWTQAYAHVPGARSTIKRVVEEWFQQQLLETVISAQALKRTGKWNLEELSALWTEEALTAAVLPRWHIDQSIKRVLGQRLGTLKAA